MMEKIIVAGANGFIGRHLVPLLTKEYEVVTLTRRAENISGARNVIWDGENLDDWSKELNGAFAIINLSGKSVNCRHNEENKKRFLILE